MDDSFLTVAEIAELLKINQQTIRNWIDRGELPAVRLGQRRVRIRRSELDRFIAAGESSGPSAGDSHQAAPEKEDAARRDAWERFHTAMAESTAALDDDPHQLAGALNELADAARSLATALGCPPR